MANSPACYSPWVYITFQFFMPIIITLLVIRAHEYLGQSQRLKRSDLTRKASNPPNRTYPDHLTQEGDRS